MNRRRILYGMIVSVLFIYLILWKPHFGEFFHGNGSLWKALVGYPRIDFSLLGKVLGEVDIWPLVICFLLSPLHVAIRSHRWKLMVQPVGELSLRESFSLQMVGYMSNSVLPLRMGEVVRGVLLADRLNISTSSALGTVLLERVVDMLTMLIVILMVSMLFHFPRAVGEPALILGILAGLSLILILYLAYKKDPFGGWIGRMIGTGKFGKNVRKQGENFAAGFAMLKATRHYSVISIESAALWVIYGLQGYLVLIAFHFTRDYPLIAESPMLASLVILVLNAVGVSLPSAPGGVGTFHAIAIFGLSLFDVPTEPAAGFALTIHAITMVYYLVGGLPFMWHEGLRFGELKRITPKDSAKTSHLDEVGNR